jgi:hypothetical protein
LISGTTHIFFPPRLEVVFRQGHSNGLSPDTLHDPALHNLRGGEADRPPRVAIGRRSADERDNGRFLDAVELALTAGSRVIGKRGLESICVVPIGDALHLAVVPANSFGSGNYREPLVELLQRQDSSPRPRRELLLFHSLQLAAISSGQLQPRRTCRLGLHPSS